MKVSYDTVVQNDIPQDIMHPTDDSTDDIVESEIQPDIVQLSKQDDRKAMYMNIIRSVIVFIICFSYFIYQVILFNDTTYNRQQTTAINKITSMHIPFIQISTNFNTTVACPSMLSPQNRWENSADSFDSTESCNIITDPMYYNPYNSNWTIYYNPYNTEIFIIPPFNEEMTANDTLLINLQSNDYSNKDITEVDDYMKYLQNMDNANLESILWTETAINDIDPNEIDFSATTRTSLSQLMYSYTATRTDGEINIIEQNEFGRLYKRYGLDYRVSDAYSSNVKLEANSTWSRDTMLALTMNTLHTQTTIIIDRKLTFLDVLSSTGGIFGLVWPGSILVVAYLLSGFKFRLNCRGSSRTIVLIPALGANFGLRDEDKRKILIYLKEIAVVSKTK